METSSPPDTRRHIRGLDRIRFVLAFCVAFGHFGLVGLPESALRQGKQIYLRLFIGNVISAPAAVIAFFVLSGLCIHYPYRRSTSIPLLPYFARREVRIVIPAAVAIALSALVGEPIHSLTKSTLWSLVCEEVYYFLYPLVLLPLFRRFGVRSMIGASFVAAAALLALYRPGANSDYISLGPWVTWLLALPCWLLGCEIAEHVDDVSVGVVPGWRLWGWRVGVLGVSMVCSILRFHARVSYPWTLDLFAVLCFFWLTVEIDAHRSDSGPPSLLDRLGLGTYSLYVMHTVAYRALQLTPLPDVVLVRFAFIFAASYVFYRCVELPSHQLARRTHRWFAPKAEQADVAPQRLA